MLHVTCTIMRSIYPLASICQLSLEIGLSLNILKLRRKSLNLLTGAQRERVKNGRTVRQPRGSDAQTPRLKMFLPEISLSS